MTRTWQTVVIGCALVMGCKSKANTGAGSAASTGSAGSSSAGSATNSGSAGSAAGSAAGSGSAAATGVWLPKQLDDKHGVVFAEKQGGDVKGIADGAQVEVVEVKELGVGDEADGEVKVKSPKGETVALPADRVILENELKRSDDGKYAVFAPVVACGDMCHTVLWFVGVDGKRVKLGDAGVDINAAYSPTTAAVGSGSLWLVSLADFTAKHVDDYMSPSYGPDGTLYVRNADGSAFKMDGDKFKQVWKAPKRKHDADDDSDGGPDEPRPVQFKDGKPVFDSPFY